MGTDLPLFLYVALSAILFTIGGVGFMVRRNVLFSLLSIEGALGRLRSCLDLPRWSFRISGAPRGAAGEALRSPPVFCSVHRAGRMGEQERQGKCELSS